MMIQIPRDAIMTTRTCMIPMRAWINEKDDASSELRSPPGLVRQIIFTFPFDIDGFSILQEVSRNGEEVAMYFLQAIS
jgi:hypothetical protein